MTSQYGLGLETGLESSNLVLAGQAVLSCHDNYTAVSILSVLVIVKYALEFHSI